jgi:hypothetical protein
MIDKITPQKLDPSMDLKLTKKNAMIDALNVMITESISPGEDSSGDIGVLKNANGNSRASYRYDSDEINMGGAYKVIGSVVDDKTKVVYFFLWSSTVDNNSIYAYDRYGVLPGGSPNTIRLIFKSSLLNFYQNDFIKADVVHINRNTLDNFDGGDEFDTDAILYFTDNRNEPKKINVYRGLLSYMDTNDGVNASDFTSNPGLVTYIAEEYSPEEYRAFYSACTAVPLFPATAGFQYDEEYKGSNFKKTAGIQIAYQLVYVDGNESAISPYSKIYVPPVIISQGSSTIINHDSNNKLEITIPNSQINKEVDSVKILVREGEDTSFLFVDEVSKSDLVSNQYKYNFYNDKVLTGVSQEDVDKTFDAVPKKAEAQAVENNRLIYGNYVEGFGNVSASATITPVYNDVSQPVFRQVKVTPTVATKNESEVPGINSPITAGFLLDFEDIDLLSTNDTVSFTMSVAPDRNFHVGRYSRVTPTNKNFTVQKYVDDLSPYESQSFLGFTEGASDAYRTAATHIWGDFVAAATGGVSFNYNYYNPAGFETSLTEDNATIGSSYFNPIIIKGETLSFSVSFQYTGSPKTGSDASNYLADIVTNYLTGATGSSDDVDDIDNAQVSRKSSFSYDLQLNNFDLLTAGYPNIGLQVGSSDGSAYYDSSPAPDYRTYLICAVGESDAYNDVNDPGSGDFSGPIGYFVLNKASATFALTAGDTTTSDVVKGVELTLDRLYDVEFATCIRRPSMTRPWIVLTKDYMTQNTNLQSRWLEFLSNIDVQQMLPSGGNLYGDNDTNDFWAVGEYGWSAENGANIGTFFGDAQTASGNDFDNYKLQFGYLTNQIDGPIEFDISNWWVMDGEAGPGGYNGTDEYNNAQVTKCGTIPLYTGWINGENDQVGIFEDDSPPDVLYNYYAGGVFFTGRPSMYGWGVNSYNRTYIKGTTEGAQNGLSFCPALKGPFSVSSANASSNAASLMYYTTSEYPIDLLHPDIEVTSSNYLSTSYDVNYKSFKTSSHHDFGVVYFDKYGRHGYVNPIGSVYVAGYSDQERDEKGRVDIEVSMGNNPPSWAKYWKLVHSKSVTVDSFIQYTAGGAYVKAGEAESDNERNIYVSLNYLQGSNVSYVSSFGARTPEGGLNMYKYEPGDRLRVVSYQNLSEEILYPYDLDFEVIDLVKLGPAENPLYEADSDADQWLQGDFVILRNKDLTQGFDYLSVKTGDHFWGNNCVVELYKPSLKTNEDRRFYYEIGETFDTVSPQYLGDDDTPLARHGGTKIIRDGDVYWRVVAVNQRNIESGSFVDIIVNTEDDAGVNLSKSNFKNLFLESGTSTDLIDGDAVGLGRPHTVYKDATESRRMASITYSLPTNPLSKRNYYGSFNATTLNFKDLPEKHGFINYIVNRGDSLLVFQEDKVSTVPISRNIIEQSDGSSLVVSAKDVLGTARFYGGQVGTDGHPESVARVDDFVYFVHASTGRVYRYSENNIVDITKYGMVSKIREAIGDNQGLRIVSGYDPINEEYLLTIKGGTNIATDFTQVVDDDFSDLVPGCTDPDACNYDEDAEVNNGTCVYPEPFYDCEGVCVNDADGDGVCDELEVEGCTEEGAFNYNPDATDSNPDSCIYYGCTDEGACNYDPQANFNDNSCDYVTCVGCTDPEAANYNPEATNEDGSCIYPGCMDPDACNYNQNANIDDGSCTYAATYYDCDNNCLNDSDGDGICDEEEVLGCTDPEACNYNPQATDDDGSCTYAEEYYDCDGNCLNDSDGDGVCDELEVEGCTNPIADNYDPEATNDDETCELTVLGCWDTAACNGNPTQDIDGIDITYDDDGSCVYATGPCDVCEGDQVVTYDADGDGICDDEEVYGCTNATACNYDDAATEDDGACDFTCYGCTDPFACNYDAEATIEDGSCEYVVDIYGVDYVDCDGNCLNDEDGDGVCDEDEKPGCMDSTACNYDPIATNDDGSCVFADDPCEICNADGTVTIDENCCLFDFETATIEDYVDSFGITIADVYLALAYAYKITPSENYNELENRFSLDSILDTSGDGEINTTDLINWLTQLGINKGITFTDPSVYLVEPSNNQNCTLEQSFSEDICFNLHHTFGFDQNGNFLNPIEEFDHDQDSNPVSTSDPLFEVYKTARDLYMNHLYFYGNNITNVNTGYYNWDSNLYSGPGTFDDISIGTAYSYNADELQVSAYNLPLLNFIALKELTPEDIYSFLFVHSGNIFEVRHLAAGCIASIDGVSPWINQYFENNNSGIDVATGEVVYKFTTSSLLIFLSPFGDSIISNASWTQEESECPTP